MTPQGDKRIKRQPVPELQADLAEYRRYLDDMVQNSGDLIPDPSWLATDHVSVSGLDKSKTLERALNEQHFRANVGYMKELMTAWIGDGAKQLTDETISRYYRFLQHCDALGLWPANMHEERDVPFLATDLGTLMDLNLLYGFSPATGRTVTRVLEIGGGYGRLAEAAFNIFGHSVQYIMVDAVPASLYYARQYLAHACPDARLGSYYDHAADGSFDFSSYDIAIVPAWHFQRLNHLRYDICVNIESMQEMAQRHVDYYLNLFESVAVEGATIYISNAHDYYFRGAFNYPRNWQRLFCANTPRSWSPDHPTEIFTKTDHDCSLRNRIIDSIYNYTLWLQTDPEDFMRRNGARRILGPLAKKLSHGVFT